MTQVHVVTAIEVCLSVCDFARYQMHACPEMHACLDPGSREPLIVINRDYGR